VIAVYEAGWSGFWLVRWLAKHGVEAVRTENLNPDVVVMKSAKDHN
jgi:hypothetical protein